MAVSEFAIPTTDVDSALASWSNLLRAYIDAARGKRANGSVALFEHRLEDNLLALQDELRTGRYRPGGYTSFYIHEPKRRLISAAPFRDRVVHHALCKIIEPRFERSFVDGSFANRVGKGTHRAIDRCQAHTRRFAYVLQVDVRQFFPSIDHQVLQAALERKVTEPDARRLIGLILESGGQVPSTAGVAPYFAGDDLFSALRPRGLPIGNLTSQFWANVYLNGFDHYVKRELGCRGYVRYVDDMLLFADDKRTLWRWKAAIEDRLAGLRLSIHSGRHPQPVSGGVPFLGFVVFPDRRMLKRRKGIHYLRRLRGLVAAYEAGEIPLEIVDASVRGWVNHVRYGNTVGLRKAVLRATRVRPPIRTASSPAFALPFVRLPRPRAIFRSLCSQHRRSHNGHRPARVRSRELSGSSSSLPDQGRQERK